MQEPLQDWDITKGQYFSKEEFFDESFIVCAMWMK